jgi:hypothetical protein
MSDRQTQEAIQKIAGTFNKDNVTMVFCTVSSVDQASRTCNCTPISGNAETDLEDVLLLPEIDDGLLLIPAIGSTIIVAISIKSAPFVIMYSAIDRAFLITENGIQLQGGEYGGLVMAEPLIIALNALQTELGLPLTTLPQITNQSITHGT